MRLHALLTEETAVAPVIGVILMVAITVILAAVIGTFVFGLHDQVTSVPPQTDFRVAYNESDTTDHTLAASACDLGGSSGNHNATIIHNDGDTVPASQLNLSTDGSVEWTTCSAVPATAEISSGETATVEIADDATLHVIWGSANGENTQTLATYTAPDA